MIKRMHAVSIMPQAQIMHLKHFDPLEAAPCTKTGTSLVRTAAEASSWEDKFGSHREQHVLRQAFVSNNIIYVTFFTADR